MKYIALLMALSFSAHAGPKTWCFLEDNQKAFRLTQATNKDGIIGFTGYMVDLQKSEISPVSGSGFFRGNKLQANLVYSSATAPTVAFFDAYTNAGVGQSVNSIVNLRTYTGSLVTVDCRAFFW